VITMTLSRLDISEKTVLQLAGCLQDMREAPASGRQASSETPLLHRRHFARRARFRLESRSDRVDQAVARSADCHRTKCTSVVLQGRKTILRRRNASGVVLHCRAE